MSLRENSGNGNPDFFYVFWKESCSYVSGINFQSSKNERTQSLKTSYISGNETFQPQI